MENNLPSTDTSLIVRVVAKIDSFVSDMDKVINKVENTSKKMEKLGKKLTLGVTTPIVGLGAKMLSLAAEAEELESKFESVFGNMTKEASEWSASFSKTMQRSEMDIKSMMSRLQNFLVGMGGTVEESYKMSQEMIERILDLSAFLDLDDMEAFDAMVSGVLQGNSTALAKFDVVVNESIIKQEALRMGITKTYDELTALEKAQIRFNVVLNSTAAAQGTVVNEADNYSSKLRALKGNLKDLGVELGEELIPVASDIVSLLLEWTKSFRELDDETKEAIIKVGGFLALLGPLLVGLSKIVVAITTLKVALAKVGKILEGATFAKFIKGGIFAGATVAMSSLVNESKKLDEELNNIKDTLDSIDQHGFKNIEQFEEEQRKVQEIVDIFDELNEKMKEANLTLDDFTFQQTSTAIIPLMKKNMFNLTDKEKEAFNVYTKFLDKIYEHYKRTENFEKALNNVRRGYQEQNVELEKRNSLEDEYNRLKEQQEQRIKDLKMDYEELQVLEEKNELIKDSIELLEELGNKERLSIDDKSNLAAVISYLNQEVGEGAVQYDKSTGAIKTNKAMLDDYLASLSGVIAQSRDKITIEIETIIKTREEDLRNINKQIKVLEKPSFLDEILNSPSKSDRVELKKAREIMGSINQKKIIEEEKRLNEEVLKEVEKIRQEMVQKSINSVKNSLNTQKRIRENQAREAELALQKQVREELRLIEYRYNVEEITQKKC